MPDALALGLAQLLLVHDQLGPRAAVGDGHVLGAVAEARARAVHGRVAAADDDDVAADRQLLAEVGLLHVVDAVLDPVEVRARDVEVDRVHRAGRDRDPVVVALELVERDVDADGGVEHELHAQPLDQADVHLDRLARQPEGGDADQHRAAAERQAVEDGALVALDRELARDGEAGRAGAHHRDALGARRDLGHDVGDARGLVPLHEEPLHGADGQRAVDVAAAARALARRRAHVRAHRRDRVRFAGKDVPLLEPPFGGEVEVAPAVRADGAGLLALDVALQPGSVDRLDEEFLGGVDGHEVDVPFLRERGRATGTTTQRGAVLRNLSSRDGPCTARAARRRRARAWIVLTHARGAATLPGTRRPRHVQRPWPPRRSVSPSEIAFLALGIVLGAADRRGHRGGGPIPTRAPAGGSRHDRPELREPAPQLDPGRRGGGRRGRPDARLTRGRRVVRRCGRHVPRGTGRGPQAGRDGPPRSNTRAIRPADPSRRPPSPSRSIARARCSGARTLVRRRRRRTARRSCRGRRPARPSAAAARAASRPAPRRPAGPRRTLGLAGLAPRPPLPSSSPRSRLQEPDRAERDEPDTRTLVGPLDEPFARPAASEPGGHEARHRRAGPRRRRQAPGAHRPGADRDRAGVDRVRHRGRGIAVRRRAGRGGGGPDGPGAAASDARPDADPCGTTRVRMEERCSVASTAADQARHAADALRDAQRAYDTLRERVERAQADADPRGLAAAKDALHKEFRAASRRARGAEDTEAAAREWLTQINELNVRVRDAQRLAEAGAAELRGALPAARADGRRGGRRTDQRRERRGRLPRGPRAARRLRGGPGQVQARGGRPARRTPPSPRRSTTRRWPADTGEPAQRLVRPPGAGDPGGDRRHVGDREGPARRPRGPRPAGRLDRGRRARGGARCGSRASRSWSAPITARAIEDGYLDMPDDDTFWSLFTATRVARDRRRAVGARLSLRRRRAGSPTSGSPPSATCRSRWATRASTGCGSATGRASGSSPSCTSRPPWRPTSGWSSTPAT